MQPLIFPRHNFTGDVFSATCWFQVCGPFNLWELLGRRRFNQVYAERLTFPGNNPSLFSPALVFKKSIRACTLCVRQKRLFRPVSLDFILRAPSFSLAGAAQLPILIEWRRALSAARYSLKAARMWCGHYFLCDSLFHFLDCVCVRVCILPSGLFYSLWSRSAIGFRSDCDQVRGQRDRNQRQLVSLQLRTPTFQATPRKALIMRLALR